MLTIWLQRKSTLPASMSWVACGVPRYDTTVGLMPMSECNTEHARCETEPTPASASVTVFSWARR
jgi:hypothetical protein